MATVSSLPDPLTMTDNSGAGGLTWNVFVRRDFPAAQHTLTGQQAGGTLTTRDTLNVEQYSRQRMNWRHDDGCTSDCHPAFLLEEGGDMKEQRVVFQWNYSYAKGTTAWDANTGVRSAVSGANDVTNPYAAHFTTSWFVDHPDVPDPAVCTTLVSGGCDSFDGEGVVVRERCPASCGTPDERVKRIMLAYGTETTVDSVVQPGSRAAMKTLLAAHNAVCSGSPRCARNPKYPGAAGEEAGVSAELFYVLTDQSGNRAVCQREVVVVDLEDPVATCSGILAPRFLNNKLFDGRACIGTNATGPAPRQACYSRGLTNVEVEDKCALQNNEHIVDAVSWARPLRTDNTQGIQGLSGSDKRLTTNLFSDVPTTAFPTSDRTTYKPRPNGEIREATGAADVVTKGTVFGGTIPHFFGTPGLDRCVQ